MLRRMWITSIHCMCNCNSQRRWTWPITSNLRSHEPIKDLPYLQQLDGSRPWRQNSAEKQPISNCELGDSLCPLLPPRLRLGQLTLLASAFSPRGRNCSFPSNTELHGSATRRTLQSTSKNEECQSIFIASRDREVERNSAT